VAQAVQPLEIVQFTKGEPVVAEQDSKHCAKTSAIAKLMIANVRTRMVFLEMIKMSSIALQASTAWKRYGFIAFS
jgi:hypothetical protein